MSKAFLDKAGIFAAMALKQEEVDLGTGKVIVRELSGADYLDALESPAGKDEKGDFDGNRFTALLIARCVVDGKGHRVFSDEDAGQIRTGSTSVFGKLGAAVKRINGLGGDQVKN